MSNQKSIQALHNKGFVILAAQRTTNAPIGWKHKDGKWGYVEEMSDKSLTRYKQTFKASTLSRSHCGFYLGFNDLCCIDLDVKKTDVDVQSIVDTIIQKFKGTICVETTKSNGFHIYFRFKTDIPNNPNFTQTDAKTSNWIEIYYRSRFIACYLSNSKRYNLIHGDIEDLKVLSKEQHTSLLSFFSEYEGKKPKIKKAKPVVIDKETLNRINYFIEQIEEQGLDITGDNPKWFRIGKAIASALGEDGFTLFNRLSRFSPLYNEDSIVDDYQSFVDGDKRERGEKITIATFFHICAEHGLKTIEEAQIEKTHPAVLIEKEFTLTLTKTEKMAEHVHYLCEAFKQAVPICCIDRVNFYVFDTTHWVLKNTREVLDLVKDFIDRSDVDISFRTLLRTVPYLKMTLDELYLTTQRNALEPMTGNLQDGIFINMENGVLHINMQTGKRKLLDHDEKYNFTTLLPFSYEPIQSCPNFEEWMNNQLPGKEMHTAYYAFVASCLTKHKSDIIMLLAGETSTGKSSLIDVTRRLIGLDNSVAVSAGTLFSGKPEAASVAMQMENKLLAYDFDAQPFRQLEMLLKVAAQEPLQGWQMHVTRRPVINYGRLLIAMNPYNYSVFNAAVARRFITLNMNVKVEKDNSVMPRIFTELAGIFNNVLNIGVKHLIENNGTIKQTDALKKNTLEFHTGQRDAIRWFNIKYLIPKESDDKSNKLTLQEKLERTNRASVVLKTMQELYGEFRIWCEDIEGYPQGKIPLRKHFSQDLELIAVRDNTLKIAGKTIRGIYVIRQA